MVRTDHLELDPLASSDPPSSHQLNSLCLSFRILHHEAGKLDPNAINRKSKNTPLLGTIFAIKRVFSEFLEAQLRSSKGVLVLFWVQFVCFMLSN